MDLKTKIIAIILLFAPMILVGQTQELITDRPDQSNSPVLIPTGAIQIETGVAIEKKHYSRGSVTNYTFNDMLVKLGVNQNFEARIGVTYVGVDSALETQPIQKGFSP